MKKRIVFLLLLLASVCISTEAAGDSVVGEDGDPVSGEDGDPVSGEDGDSVSEEDGGGASLPMLLTDDTFTDAVKDTDFVVVEFYAPWCHHCSNVMAILADISTTLEPQGVKFARVDIDQSKELKARFQISEVPDVRLFRRGVSFPYMGPNEDQGKEALINYLLEESTKTIDEGPLTLTEDNFDNIINSTPLMLVEFYADWCVHCQQLEPHFHAAARRLRHNDPPILLGQVKVPDQIEVAKRYGITGYPLLFVFRYGKQYNYTGPREEEGIVNYMQKQTGPSSKVLTTLEEAKQFSQSPTETRAIAFFTTETDPKLIEVYTEAANDVRMDLVSGHTTDESIAEEMGFRVNTIVIFHPSTLVSKYEKGHSIIKSIPSKKISSLTDLLLKHARPLVGLMTKDNQLSVYLERPLLVAYCDLTWELDRKAILHWHDMIASVAKDFTSKKQSLIFAMADEQDFSTDLKVLGLSDWGEDVAVGIFASGRVRYSLKDELTPENLREFVQAFIDGTLESHLNSEPIPKSTKGSTIKKVVGDTFKKFMSDKKKNVVIKLCIPEHPECEKAKEFYPKVVARYEGMKEIVFGEMNMALNDLPPSVKMEGEIPVYLFSAQGSKDIIQVSPRPTDDADLIFFLKFRHSVRPTLTERDIERKAREKKRKASKKDKKKEKSKKNKKDEL